MWWLFHVGTCFIALFFINSVVWEGGEKSGESPLNLSLFFPIIDPNGLHFPGVMPGKIPVFLCVMSEQLL
jgi:hypothetical protein